MQVEEIRKLHDTCNLRDKFQIAVLASSGVRIGSWDYFCLGDLIQVKGKTIGCLVVYRGEKEQYQTFVSSEAMKLFSEYLDQRRENDEVLTQNSPLFLEQSGGKLNSISARSLFNFKWDKFAEKRDFKRLHGFRKFFKSQLENNGMKTLHVEMLLGHNVGLNGNYQDTLENKPTFDALAESYWQHEKCLWISDEWRSLAKLKEAKEENEKTKEQYMKELKELKIDQVIERDETKRKIDEMKAAIQNLMGQIHLLQVKKVADEYTKPITST